MHTSDCLRSRTRREDDIELESTVNNAYDAVYRYFTDLERAHKHLLHDMQIPFSYFVADSKDLPRRWRVVGAVLLNITIDMLFHMGKQEGCTSSQL